MTSLLVANGDKPPPYGHARTARLVSKAGFSIHYPHGYNGARGEFSIRERNCANLVVAAS